MKTKTANGNPLGMIVSDLHTFDNWHYAYGTVDQGLHAIETTISAAAREGLAIIATTIGCKQPAEIVRHLVPSRFIVEKGADHDAFANAYFRCLIDRFRCDRWILLGYNRDCCVIETCRGGIRQQLRMITCLQLMLSQPPGEWWRLEESEQFFRSQTEYLERPKDVQTLISTTKAGDDTIFQRWLSIVRRRSRIEQHRNDQRKIDNG